jgi:hypothetical protein
MDRSVAQFKWETCKAKLIRTNLILLRDFHRPRTSPLDRPLIPTQNLDPNLSSNISQNKAWNHGQSFQRMELIEAKLRPSLKAETASRAIAALNNTEVKELGRSKLFLAHQYSVKLSTPTDILTAVKEQIETLEQNLRENGHVRLKCYPPPNGTSRYSSIRVSNSIMIYNSKPCSTMTLASHRHQCCSSLVFQRSTFLFLFYKINNNSRGSSRTCGNKWFFAASSLLGLRRPVQGVTCCAQAYI